MLVLLLALRKVIDRTAKRRDEHDGAHDHQYDHDHHGHNRRRRHHHRHGDHEHHHGGNLQQQGSGNF